MAARTLRLASRLLVPAAAAVLAGCGRPSPVNFGVLADVQFQAAPAAGTRYYDRSWLKLRDALERFEGRDLRFIVHLGDLVDVAPERKAGVLARLGVGRGYSAFTEGGWRFVVLNGDELGLNFPKDEALARESAEMFDSLAAAGRPNATIWNGGLGREQMAFLEAELAGADRAGRPVVVFCHFPVLPPAAHNLWNDEAVLARLDAHPSAKAYFCGHNHAGGCAVRNGVVYLNFAGLVETADAPAGAGVTLRLDRILVDGFGREPDRTFAVRPRSD
jgi:hypothetical protein